MFKFDFDYLLGVSDIAFIPSGLCSISLGGSSSKSKQKSQSTQESGTRWNQAFMDQLREQGPGIQYTNEQDGVTAGPVGENGQQTFTLGAPKFQGLEDMDFGKLEKGLYERQVQNIDPQYQQARAQTREELSQAGMLNSPVQYSEGGAIDQLQRRYLDEVQKSATDASNKTIELKQRELARKTGFDLDLVKLFQTILGQYADVALKAGQYSSGQSTSSGSGSGSGWNFGLFNFGGSSNNSTSA